MDAKTLWEKKRRDEICHRDLGIALDCSRVLFQDSEILALEGKIKEAFSAMEALEKGSIANPDEKRMVGHYWVRDSALAPNRELRAAIDNALVAIEEFATAVHSGQIKPPKSEAFRHILVIGIGGSALGPQFVSQALKTARDPLDIYFFDNTDPDGMERVLRSIPDLGATLCVVISKSGGTKETRNGELIAKSAYQALGVSFANMAVAITGEGSELDQKAKQEGWLKRFPMWDWVGGRTSELSAVGLLPAALQGFSIRQMLQGAAEMDVWTRTSDPHKNPAMKMALMWHRLTGGRGEKDMVVLPYSDRLELFSRYLQQLIMESIGKEKDLQGRIVHQGIAVYGNKGSTDQHAFVQQLREGVANFFAVFVHVLNEESARSAFGRGSCGSSGSGSSGSDCSSRDLPTTWKPAHIAVEPGTNCGDYLSGFFLGTRDALFENGRQSITVTLRQVSESSVGALIALFERAVGFYATLVGVNAYHQPGVEAGKKAAASVLVLKGELDLALEKSGAKAQTAEELANTMKRPEQVDQIFVLLRRMEAVGKLTLTPGASHLEDKFACT